MKLDAIVLRLRNKCADTFDFIGGAADYAFAVNETLDKEMAFVIPLQETAERNEYDNLVSQVIYEQFAVIVAIKNDTNYKDKIGFTSSNRLHDIRYKVFKAVLGLDLSVIDDTDYYSSTTLVYYKGAQLLDFNRTYIWQQYTFEYGIRVQFPVADDEVLADFNTIYAQYELDDDNPTVHLPVTEKLPVTSFEPDAEQIIDLTSED